AGSSTATRRSWKRAWTKWVARIRQPRCSATSFRRVAKDFDFATNTTSAIPGNMRFCSRAVPRPSPAASTRSAWRANGPARSNTTGEAAEALGRKWIAVESELDYVIGSAFRFMPDWPDDDVTEFITRCRSQERRGEFRTAKSLVLDSGRSHAASMMRVALPLA